MHYLYLITRDDGEKYVGVSIHPDVRAHQHKNGRGSIHLENKEFTMEILAEGDYEYIYGLEEEAIQAFNAKLNIAKGDMVGSKNGRAKLKETTVMLIKELVASGLSQKQLAKIFDVSRQTIGGIAIGTNWKNVPGPITIRRALVSIEDREKLKELKRAGLNCAEIAQITGLKYATVYSHVREI